MRTLKSDLRGGGKRLFFEVPFGLFGISLIEIDQSRLELEALGHVPHIDHWEVSAGGNIMEWMDKRHNEADHVLCIISKTYLTRPYSSLERLAWKIHQA